MFKKNILLIILYIVLLSCNSSSPSGRRSINKKATDETKSYNNDNSRQDINRNLSTKEYDSSKQTSSSTLSGLYNTYKKSVFLIYTSDGDNNFQGSGFFVSKNGLAVSNYHVFEGTSKGLEVIKTINGKEYKIEKVLEKNKDFDYIIFKVDLGIENISNPIAINNNIIQIGQDVFAIGNPKGLESTLSKGIISSLRADNKIIQTTAEITNGSSGGPLLNMNGDVIGITTSGLGEANLNFAININVLKLERFLNFRAKNNSTSYIYYPIKKFVDGDTFWIDDGTSKGKKIRLIGVDTPETRHPKKGVEYFGKEASNYVKNLLAFNKVRLEFDIEKKDRYGRLLAYVYLEDGTFLNANLVENGYAQVSTYPPNVKYADYFLKLERHARNNNLGLWMK